MSDKAPKTPIPGETQCEKCDRRMAFAHNVHTGKRGPVDLATCVYFVRRNADSEGVPLSMTAKRLMEALVSLTILVDGQPVTYRKDEILGFFVSHWSTCPSAEFFSKRKGGMHQ